MISYPWVLEREVGKEWERVARIGYQWPREAAGAITEPGTYRVRNIMTGEVVRIVQ